MTSPDRAALVALAAERPGLGSGGAHPGGMHVTWLGHACVLAQFHGWAVLADPIFSHRCAPVQVEEGVSRAIEVLSTGLCERVRVFFVILPVSFFLAPVLFFSLGGLSNPFSCRLFLFVVGVVFAHACSGLAQRASLRARWTFLSVWNRNCHPSMRW